MRNVAFNSIAVAATALATVGIAPVAADETTARPLPNAGVSPVPDNSPRFKPFEVLLQFDRNSDPAQRASALAKVGGRTVEEVRTKAMVALGEPGFAIVRTGIPVENAVAALRKTPGVAIVEPNWIVTNDAVSNDPYFTGKKLWGMTGPNSVPTNPFGSGAAQAWAKNQFGAGNVHVAVIDTGVMHTHPDLAANTWTNPYDPVDGIDNDGNGYVDDTKGWDFLNNDNSTFDGTVDSHGTHVAGTIGAVGGNGIGVAGVCWKVTMISCKFLGASGGSIADAVKAIDYVTDLKLRHGLNIVASNNSWGGGGFSASLSGAIDRARRADILFVAAAGNSNRNNDTTPHYPSSYLHANVISVASITSTGTRSSFSNYGLTSVDLGAPGSNIWSTVPLSGGGAGYASYNGTSMATPHVTGGAALFAAAHPFSASTAAGIKAALFATGLNTPSLSGITVTGKRLFLGGF